jgi:hypothetical protein
MHLKLLSWSDDWEKKSITRGESFGVHSNGWKPAAFFFHMDHGLTKSFIICWFRWKKIVSITKKHLQRQGKKTPRPFKKIARMRDLDTIHEQIEKEKAKIEKLAQQDVRAGSHLGFQKKPAIAFDQLVSDTPGELSSDEGGGALVSEQLSELSELEAQESEPEQQSEPEERPREPLPEKRVPTHKASPVARGVISPRKPVSAKARAPSKIGANLGDAHFERLRKMLEGTAASVTRLASPPPVAEIVAKKYTPIVELVENAFDCLEAWAIRIKNWKLWTLLMDQYGLYNTFPMPALGACPAPPSYRSALGKAVTQHSASFDPCVVLLLKQHMFHEEVHKVIRPWGRTNFSTPLMELGETLSALIRSIPGGQKEREPPPEILDFISNPNAAEQVYDGTSPVFSPELSRKLSDKISTETIAVKRRFMDTDLLHLRHQTDANYRRLLDLQAQCNAKRGYGVKLDEVQDVYRAKEWHEALLIAYEALSQSLNSFNWVE